MNDSTLTSNTNLPAEAASKTGIHTYKGFISPDMRNETFLSYCEYREKVRRSIFPEKVAEQSMISEMNFCNRHEFVGSRQCSGIDVYPGSVCEFDFGDAYQHEIGHQHFAVIISINQNKALVVPMTSNPVQYERAYDPILNPNGRKHLMRLGQPEGLNKKSVLFLNDAKYVNTARVISLNAQLDTSGKLFRTIVERLKDMMFSEENMARHDVN